MTQFTFLRAVPDALREGIALGRYLVDGSIVRDVTSGQIIGHLQATGSVLEHLGQVGQLLNPFDVLTSGIEIVQNVRILEGLDWLQNAMQAQLGMQGFDLLTSTFGVVQNAQIKQRLEDLDVTLNSVLGLQIAQMLASGMIVGASVLNQVMLRQRLAAIEKSLASQADRFDRAREKDRQRRIRSIFRQLDMLIEIIDSLPQRGDPRHVAAATEVQIAQLIAKLGDELQSRLDDLPADRKGAAAAVAESYGIAKAIQLGRHAQLQAMMEVDDPAAAAKIAKGQSRNARGLAWLVEPVDILSRTDGRGPDATDIEAHTRGLMEQVFLLLNELKTAARATLGTGLLADRISRNGWSSRAYLAESRSTEGDPIMIVPTESSFT